MIQETLQQSADRLKNFPGNVKGEVFRTHAEFVKFKEGEEGIKKLEEKLRELNVPVVFSEIKPFGWISEGISSLTIITAKEIFNWTDKDIFEMGRFAPRVSFIIKMMTQYLVSIDTLFKNATKYWKNNYDFGHLEALGFDKEKRQIYVREFGLETHPTVCHYHAGYLKGVCEFAVKSDNITVEETACVHEGAEYHEFLIRW
jgi:hypothetical protein